MSIYNLTKSPVDSNRIKKIAKDVIANSEQDRKIALETAEEFKTKAEQFPPDIEGAGEAIIGYESLRVECLKLAQTSKNQVTKILSELIKLEGIQAKNTKEDLTFSSLDED